MEAKELLEIFFAEAEDLLARIEQGLLTLEDSPEDLTGVQEVFRAVHTLKSSAAMVGLDSLSEYAHLMENLLDRLRHGRLSPTRPLISQFLAGQNLLKTMVERAAQGLEPISEPEFTAQKEQLARFMGLEGLGPPSPTPAVQEGEKTPRYFEIQMAFREDLFHTGQDPLMFLHELQDLGEILKVKADHRRVPPLPEINPYRLYLSWTVVLQTSYPRSTVEEVFCFVKDDHPVEIREVSQRDWEGMQRSTAGKPIGELLVEEGLLDTQELQAALGEQKKIGQILLEKGRISPKALSQIMADQERSRNLFRKSTIRVETRKLDDLADSLEELAVNLARMANEMEEMGPGLPRSLQEGMDRLEQTLRVSREQVMRLRMFPLAGTFQRLQRMARDLAAQEHKEIKIEVEGAETELDKDLIEQITDPLKHIIRNAVDHGLESPEERREKGKPPQGLLTLRAFQQEGSIIIQIRDDGRGLDLERIHRKALEQGWLPAHARPTAEELQRLILLPGFSTRETISEVSGRGVGLDVVQDQISRLGGRVEIHSLPHQGTTLTLHLPLTLAVLEALRVEAGQDTYLVPISSIVSLKAVEEKELKTIEGREEVFRFEDQYLPAVRLEAVLGGAGRKNGGRKIALVLHSPRRRFALLADRVVEARQVVIKSLKTHFRSVPGVAGGAIMGDGSVCLILDVLGLDRLIFGPTEA